MQKDIAVVIQNYVQFINVKLGIDELIKKGYSVDIYCPKDNDNSGFFEMFDDIKKLYLL